MGYIKKRQVNWECFFCKQNKLNRERVKLMMVCVIVKCRLVRRA